MNAYCSISEAHLKGFVFFQKMLLTYLDEFCLPFFCNEGLNCLQILNALNNISVILLFLSRRIPRSEIGVVRSGIKPCNPRPYTFAILFFAKA